MPSPQKNKGSGYEREVAKFLSDLYGESFIRATIGNKWWSKDQISKKSRECPGEGWILGRSSIRKIVQ